MTYLVKPDALWMGIHVHTALAQKTHEGLLILARELNCETRWGRDGSDNRQAGCEGFLHDFEGRSAADEEDGAVEVDAAEQRVADRFVEGIMPADVLAEDDEAAGLIEESSGVQAAGAIERRLRLPHRCGELEEDFRFNGEIGCH